VVAAFTSALRKTFRLASDVAGAALIETPLSIPCDLDVDVCECVTGTIVSPRCGVILHLKDRRGPPIHAIAISMVNIGVAPLTTL